MLENVTGSPGGDLANPGLHHWYEYCEQTTPHLANPRALVRSRTVARGPVYGAVSAPHCSSPPLSTKMYSASIVGPSPQSNSWAPWRTTRPFTRIFAPSRCRTTPRSTNEHGIGLGVRRGYEPRGRLPDIPVPTVVLGGRQVRGRQQVLQRLLTRVDALLDEGTIVHEIAGALPSDFPLGAHEGEEPSRVHQRRRKGRARCAPAPERAFDRMDNRDDDRDEQRRSSDDGDGNEEELARVLPGELGQALEGHCCCLRVFLLLSHDGEGTLPFLSRKKIKICAESPI